MKPELILTSDGSHTLFVRSLKEHYHSINGAITESLHVFIKNAFLCHSNKKVTVFEVGFGTGLNCLLTANEAEKKKISVKYISSEKYPLDLTITKKINYPEIIGGKAQQLWEKIHASDWGSETTISPFFSLTKINHDLINADLSKLPNFDIVYFDAFAPDIQPDMWSKEIILKISKQCNRKAIISTYSSKGEIRRRLQSAGFSMEKIPGPPGKREILRGIKNE